MKKFFLKHIYLLVFFAVFFGLISYVFGDEFFDFQKSQNLKEVYNQRLNDSQDRFHHNDVIELGDTVFLHSTPDKELLESLVSSIDNAQIRVWLEVYIFTEKRILEALMRAHERGVDVRVLLENNPYMIPHINDKHYETLKESGVPVKWSDPLNYALNHSKFMLVDERAFVSTGNYSFASFNSNRDIFLEISHNEIVGELETLFEYDYTHEPFGVTHPNIVLSPDNSRHKIESLFRSAQESIDMYFPYISDTNLLELVIETAQRGIDIDFIIGEDARENSPEEIQRLQDVGVSIYYMKKPKLHAKAIIMDNELIYIGSINFSRHSMDLNREVGILIKDKFLVNDLSQLFESDISLLQ